MPKITSLSLSSHILFLQFPHREPVASQSEHSSSSYSSQPFQLPQSRNLSHMQFLLSFTFQMSPSSRLEILPLKYYLNLFLFLHFHHLNLVPQYFSMRFLSVTCLSARTIFLKHQSEHSRLWSPHSLRAVLQPTAPVRAMPFPR